jgi:hypothetical protein
MALCVVFKDRPFRWIPQFELGVFSERLTIDWLGRLIAVGPDRWGRWPVRRTRTTPRQAG